MKSVLSCPIWLCYHRMCVIAQRLVSLHRFAPAKGVVNAEIQIRNTGENSCFTFRWAEGVNWLDGTVA